jgi:hypothetical protein
MSESDEKYSDVSMGDPEDVQNEVELEDEETPIPPPEIELDCLPEVAADANEEKNEFVANAFTEDQTVLQNSENQAPAEPQTLFERTNLFAMDTLNRVDAELKHPKYEHAVVTIKDELKDGVGRLDEALGTGLNMVGNMIGYVFDSVFKKRSPEDN